MIIGFFYEINIEIINNVLIFSWLSAICFQGL
nr:MAG TPA: hypothetical protein [Caudoviricetes sp.]